MEKRIIRIEKFTHKKMKNKIIIRNKEWYILLLVIL